MTDDAKTRQRRFRLRHPERVKEIRQKFYQSHPNYDKEHHKQWQLEHPNYNKEWRKNHPDKTHNERSKEYRKNHPKIIKAQRLAQRIPVGKMCQFGNCDATENLERAHLDYNKPLEVVTFCRKHHNLVDILYREMD